MQEERNAMRKRRKRVRRGGVRGEGWREEEDEERAEPVLLGAWASHDIYSAQEL